MSILTKYGVLLFTSCLAFPKYLTKSTQYTHTHTHTHTIVLSILLESNWQETTNLQIKIHDQTAKYIGIIKFVTLTCEIILLFPVT